MAIIIMSGLARQLCIGWGSSRRAPAVVVDLWTSTGRGSAQMSVCMFVCMYHALLKGDLICVYSLETATAGTPLRVRLCGSPKQRPKGQWHRGKGS